ncbi:MAG: leucyl aminopeptidase [Chloroflexi bacterium]|nr:leucyl aminopeptidase [Chloroflexota bacterium]
MNISLQQVSATEVSTPLLAIGIFEDTLAGAGDAAAVDAQLGGVIGQLVADKEVTGKQNELTVIHTHGKIPAQRVCIVGLGKQANFTTDTVRQAAAVVAKRAGEKHITQYATVLLGLDQAGVAPEEIACAIVEGALLGLYKYERFKKPNDEEGAKVGSLTIVCPKNSGVADAARRGIGRGEVLSGATNLARDLSNGPPNLVTPAYLAETAQSVAQRLGLGCEVFDVDELRRRKMGAILAVGAGSVHPPCLVVMRYQGAPSSDKVFAAVGKGITFDSGGLDIKPGDSMLTMKHDMSGAAAVIGFVQAVAELKLPVNVMGLICAAENMLSENAYRPSDIITTYNGKTIEIGSTDAEGRLVLADGLAYAVEQKASVIVDLATLTGACIVALGTIASGVLGNNDSLLSQVEKAAQETGERVWRLPLWKEYGEQMKSEIADLKNVGGRWGGAITAAYFLQQFVGDVPWVHVDIAGTAYISPADQPYYPKDRPYLSHGATGVGVRLLADVVKQWAGVK